MDLFGKKRIAELEAENARLRSNLLNEEAQHRTEETALKNQNEYLIRTIRDMDDKLFSISQCTDWPQMQPRISALVEEMTARKVIESKRIGSLITRELHETYKPESAALKQITKGKA